MYIDSMQYDSHQANDVVIGNSYAVINNWGSGWETGRIDEMYNPYGFQSWMHFLGSQMRRHYSAKYRDINLTGYETASGERKDNLDSRNQSVTDAVSTVGQFSNNPAIKRLWEIASLTDNWNDNGAKKFSGKLLKKVYMMLQSLNIKPLLFPTACGSIQMEYEKETGEYLEFEVFEENTHVFSIDINGHEKGWVLPSVEESENVKKLVDDFYVQNA